MIDKQFSPWAYTQTRQLEEIDTYIIKLALFQNLSKPPTKKEQ